MLYAVDRRTSRGRSDLRHSSPAGDKWCARTRGHIDGTRERFQVAECKAGHWTAYPVADVVVEALIEYLRSGRPQTEDRHVIFRVLTPRTRISNGATSSSVALYLRKAGMQVRRAGAYTLRHTCVQRLIDAEFPFKTIGDYAGYRSPQSTEIHAKIAIAALRQLAMGNREEL
jgi:integrase/recombinase XerD